MTSGRKDCMSGDAKCDPKGPQARREALYCQGSHSQMSRTAIAEAMEINPSTLAKWLDPTGTDRIPEDRLDHLLALTDDNPAFVRYFANLQGFVVYDPKPAARGEMTRLVSEFGDLLKAIDARADGTTAEEADRIEKEGTDLIGVVRRAIESAKRDAAMPAALRVIK